jgi:hypothetical protein
MPTRMSCRDPEELGRTLSRGRFPTSHLKTRQPALAVAALERAVRIRRAENLDPQLALAAEQALAAARAAAPGP